MRKTIQILLCIFAVVALIVTGIAFYQIVLASSIHGAPVRFVNTTAGPYSIKVAFYNDPINAGDAIPFNIAVAPGTQGSFTYQVTATPGPGVPGSLAQGDINTGQTQYGVSGSITFVTRGSWTLNIIINGPQGQGEAALPITAVAPPAIPAWLAWNIGLLPVYGLLIFWFVQVSRKSTHQPTNTVPAENMSEDGRSVLHGSSS